MWISELSERTQIPVDTIKHYLRIGVLPKGESVGPMRAEYDEGHVQRLRLIHAMTEVGSLRLDVVRRIFESLDRPGTSLREAVESAHDELSTPWLDNRTPTDDALGIVDDLIRRQGWQISPGSLHRQALAVRIDSLVEMDGLLEIDGLDLDELLGEYAGEMDRIATYELSHLDTAEPEKAMHQMVVGTVLTDPVLMLLRRLAHENASRRWDELGEESMD